jgi:hypothetical protein
MCSLKWLWWLKAKSGQGSFLFLRVATIGKCHVAVLLAQSRHRVNKQVGWNWSSTLMHHNVSKDHTYCIREHEIADVTKKARIYTILLEIFTLCLCF